MRHNPNKAVSANRHGITISYTDSCKHFTLPYENEKSGILKTLQTEGNKFSGKSYQKIGIKDSLTQQKIYRAALYGLSVYTPDEISKMSFGEKTKITSNQKKVQRFLDKWKQEICHKKLGSFLTTIFKKSQLATDLANYPAYLDLDNKNKMNFKDLGINKDMIIHKLMTTNLLPRNYYELR